METSGNKTCLLLATNIIHLFFSFQVNSAKKQKKKKEKTVAVDDVGVSPYSN